MGRMGSRRNSPSLSRRPEKAPGGKWWWRWLWLWLWLWKRMEVVPSLAVLYLHGTTPMSGEYYLPFEVRYILSMR